MKTPEQIKEGFSWIHEHYDEVDPHVCYCCMEHIDDCGCGHNDFWIHIDELEQYVNDPNYNTGEGR
jgi:hypothetical protein